MELLAAIPPMLARVPLAGSGPNCQPSFARPALSRSRTTPAWQVTSPSSASSSTIVVEQARRVHHDAAAEALARQAAAGPAGGDRDSVFGGESYRRLHVLDAARQHHARRADLVDAGVGAVKRQVQRVVIDPPGHQRAKSSADHLRRRCHESGLSVAGIAVGSSSRPAANDAGRLGGCRLPGVHRCARHCVPESRCGSISWAICSSILAAIEQHATHAANNAYPPGQSERRPIRIAADRQRLSDSGRAAACFPRCSAYAVGDIPLMAAALEVVMDTKRG